MSTIRSTSSDSEDFGQELEALGAVLKALSPLSTEAKAFVFRTAGERLNLAAPAPDGKQSRPPSGLSGGEAGLGHDSLDGVSPKQFLKVKKPLTELQRMVCLAYYLTYARQTPQFKTADLTALNTEAAGGKFSNPSVTVNNATIQSHFFAPAGKQGLKQITGLCEDYVAALPNQEAAKAVQLENKPSRRKPPKKRNAKEE